MNDVIRLVTDKLRNSDIFEEKFQSIKFGDYNISSGRIELRYFGGAGYEDMYDEVVDLVYKALYILYISRSDTLQNEYNKQLYKLITNTLKSFNIESTIYIINNIKKLVNTKSIITQDDAITYVTRIVKRDKLSIDSNIIERYIEQNI